LSFAIKAQALQNGDSKGKPPSQNRARLTAFKNLASSRRSVEP
jgi:hypothetical protein